MNEKLKLEKNLYKAINLELYIHYTRTCTLKKLSFISSFIGIDFLKVLY